jgi:TPR repeat protein
MEPKKTVVSPRLENTEDPESEITQYLKVILLELRHRTLFRDLQYISAFVSTEILNNTEKGRAFWHVGLGALACKDEYCRTMVDLADKIVTRDSIKRRAAEGDKKEEGLLKAKDYWILAAREGNMIAQRELASLYLAHPDVPPVVSLPLSLSKDIFKDDMTWKEGWEGSPQSFQLAMHWMRLAANNGDSVAQEKVREQTRETSSLP